MKTVDEYIAAQTEVIRSRLEEVRAIIRRALPETTEAIKWNQPAFLHQSGMILTTFSSHKHHINVVVTPSAKDRLADKLADFKTGKGSLQIPHDRRIPADLVEALVRERWREYTEDGVTWM